MTKHICKISHLNYKRLLRKLQKMLGGYFIFPHPVHQEDRFELDVVPYWQLIELHQYQTNVHVTWRYTRGTRRAAAFWIRCGGVSGDQYRPARTELKYVVQSAADLNSHILMLHCC